MSAPGSQVNDHEAVELFGKIVAYLGHVEVDERCSDDALSSYLRLGVLRLRLCRWYDWTTQITEVVGVSIGSVWGHLNSIRLLSGEAGAQASETSSFDNWMVRELDFLSQKHHTDYPQNTDRTTLNGEALNSLIAQVSNATEMLEKHFAPSQAADVKERLDLIRHEDAKHINRRQEANQRDLQFLEYHSTQVDPAFAKLVAFRKGHDFVDVLIDGSAVVGDEVAADWKGEMASNGNLYEHTKVTQHGVAVIGNRYGGSSIFATYRKGTYH